MEELEQQLRPGARPLRGRLRVDMPSRIARRHVAPALPGFLADQPEIELELGSSDRVIDLVHEGVDLALRVGTPEPSSLVVRPIGARRLVNCASPRYLAHHGTPRSPAELSRHLAVQYAETTGGRPTPREWLEGAPSTAGPCPARSRWTLPRPISPAVSLDWA